MAKGIKFKWIELEFDEDMENSERIVLLPGKRQTAIILDEFMEVEDDEDEA